MQPSIGRIVIFTQADPEPPFSGTRQHPAVITRIHGGGHTPSVNLQVFYDAGPVAHRTSVPYGDEHASTGGWARWNWPERV